MPCKKGCGSDANKIELVVKDLIRQMIEMGQLQEGLVDCSDRRLRRDNRVLACDQVKDAFCQMLDNGDLCLVLPERIIVKETGHICLLMSDGTENCSLTTLKDTKLQSYVIDGFTAKAVMSDGTDGPTLDLTDAFSSVAVGVKQNPDGSVTLSKKGAPDVTIPAIKVKAVKAGDGTVTITNQDGSTVTIDPVRQGARGPQGERGRDGERGPKGEKGDQGIPGPVNMGRSFENTSETGKWNVNVDGTTIHINDQGQLVAKPRPCVKPTNLNTGEGGLSVVGVQCFSGEGFVPGLPRSFNDHTNNTQSDAKSLGEFDDEVVDSHGSVNWSGYQIGNERSIIQYIINDVDDTNLSAGIQTAWSRVNNYAMSDDGEYLDPEKWSAWKRETDLAVTVPPAGATYTASNGAKLAGNNIEVDYNPDDFEIRGGKLALKQKECLKVANVTDLKRYKGVHCVVLPYTETVGLPANYQATTPTVAANTAVETGNTRVLSGTWTGTSDGGILMVSEPLGGGVTWLRAFDPAASSDWSRIDNVASSATAPAESRYVDVRVSATTTAHQVAEGSTANIIYTVTNTGSATASLVTLDITNAIPGSKRVSYGAHTTDKVKAGDVNKVSDVKYTIANLQSGGAVSITIPVTYQDFGTYTHSVVGVVSSDNVDKSADDNRGTVAIEVTSARDSSYQPTQSCPALQIVDIPTSKTLLLMDYGAATYVTNANYFVQEPIAQPATLNRLNIYSPTTTQIRLRAAGAGTTVVHGYYLGDAITTNGLQETLDKPSDGTYSFLDMSERSTGYDKDGKRYALKPNIFTGTKSGDGANGGTHFLGSNIMRDKRTYHGFAPKGVTSNFVNGELTINGIKPGTWMAVSFRPNGTDCEWQTVLLAVPVEVTNKLQPGLKLTRTQGTASHVQIKSSLANRADVVKGYLVVNGDVSADTPVVPLNQRQSDKAAITAPSGTRNAYKLTVSGGKVNPNATSTGNVKITPNAAGTEIDVVVEAAATAADSFIYRNGDVVIEMKIA